MLQLDYRISIHTHTRKVLPIKLFKKMLHTLTEVNRKGPLSCRRWLQTDADPYNKVAVHSYFKRITTTLY